MSKCIVCVVITLSGLWILGCSDTSPQPQTPSPLSKVRIIQTEHFVTFLSVMGTNPSTYASVITDAQQAAEQWMYEHPEYLAKEFSTSQNGHSGFAFCLTLRIEKK